MANHKNKGNRKIDIKMPKQGEVAVYSNQKVRNALDEIQEDMSLYKGVRLTEVMEAVYIQGKKDGQTEILDEVEAQTKALQKLRPPKIGRPRKKK